MNKQFWKPRSTGNITLVAINGSNCVSSLPPRCAVKLFMSFSLMERIVH